MSFSSHAANKANNIYVLVKDFIQGISSKLGSSTTISAENLYTIDFTQPSERFVLSLHYNGDISYLFVNRTAQLKFKPSVSYLDRNFFCLSNLSADWSVTNMVKIKRVV